MKEIVGVFIAIIRENIQKGMVVNQNAFLYIPSARSNRNICAEMWKYAHKKSNLRLGEIAQSLIIMLYGVGNISIWTMNMK